MTDLSNLSDGPWSAYGAGFGDLWASLNLCLRMSEAQRRPVHISQWLGDSTNCESRMRELLTLLDLPEGVTVIVSPDRPAFQCGGLPWGSRYFPTKQQWKPGHSLLTHQLNGVSSAHLKNPPETDLALFKGFCSGLIHAPVGLPLTVGTCVDLLANSSVFVGVCSGMSTLALSVGVPTYVLEYGVLIDWWYGPNNVIKCAGVPDFIKKYNELSHLLK